MTILFDVKALEDLRTKIGEWSTRNFGGERQGRRPLQCVLGITEEYGELLEGTLRYVDALEGLGSQQTAVWARLDAVADIMIYALDLCYTLDIKVEDLTGPPHVDSGLLRFEVLYGERGGPGEDWAEEILIEGVAVCIGRLSHSVLKVDQGIRTEEDHPGRIKDALLHMWRLLYLLSDQLGENLNRLVARTAAKVLARDWVARPADAHSVVEETERG